MLSYAYAVLSRWLPYPLNLIGALIALLVASLAIVAVIPIIIGWVDRKYGARIQSRWGPTYVGPFGLLQNVADLIKLLGKRVITTNVDILSYTFVPIALTAAAFLMILIIPWGGPNLSIVNIPYNLLFIYVAMAVSPLLILLAGWSENNKYAIIGGFRGATQIATYELALIVTILSVTILSGSYNINDIVAGQSSVWYVVYLPLAFILFITAGYTVVERDPFDIPEATQELLAGWKVEYSGLRYGLFLLSDYVKIFMLSMLVVYLFLGGWNGPLLPAFVWFWIKTIVTMMILLTPRWVYPRVRIDQLVKFGWNWMLPLAIINLLAVGMVVFV
ncbi:MAG: NADH-quinone oxidoreductase subunit H [Candidatus Parvarchaeota archaeon]|nr:NADH-quinone oxidoreductase subunit H [Candidatus Parvarchaeota archaeon]